jgi:hypothetical protein
VAQVVQRMNPEYLIVAAGIFSFIGLLALHFIAATLLRRARARRVFLHELQLRERRRRVLFTNSTAGSTDHESKTAELDRV